jgi:O-antigen ligase/Flp pilus assembly protein TadD
VFLVPVVFDRRTQEIFEVPKVALLVTGALALGAAALAGALGALGARGSKASNGPFAALRSWPRRDPLGFSVLLYLISCALSAWIAPNRMQSFLGAPESTAGLRTALATAAVFYAFRSLRGSPERLDRIARAASWAALVAAFYGGLQAIGRDPLPWGRTASFGSALRVFGTLGHPNFLGGSLAMSIPLMLHCRGRAASAPGRMGWTAGLVLALAVLVATLSRAAWVGFACGLGAWPLLDRLARQESGERREADPAQARRRRLVIGAVAAGVLLVGASLALRSPLGRPLRARFEELVNPHAATTQTRVHIWRSGLRMAADHPVLGIGLDSFGVMFPAYRTVEYWRLEWGATPVKAHNEAIQILATQGAFGAATTLLVVGVACFLLLRLLRGRNVALRQAAVAVGASWIAFAAQDLASFTVVGLGVPLAALAGWVASAQEEVAPSAPRERAPRGAPAWAWALAIGLAGAAFFPLVVEPWRAEASARHAATLPERSPEQAAALADAGRHAPWDSRYPAQIAFLWYRRAQDDPDSTTKRAELASARAASERATLLEPQSGMYRTNQGEIEVEQCLLRPPASTAAEAMATLQGAIAVDPTNGQTLDRIAFSLARLGRKAEARVVALRLAALYPDLAPPFGLLGLMALDEHRTSDGIDTLRLALARNWRDQPAAHASAWSNLAVGYLSARRYREARDAAAEALQLDPKLASAQHNLKLAEGVLQTIGTAPAAH